MKREIATPSQLQYKELMISQSNSLQCPCKHMSVEHKQFMTVNNSFHQVCSSDFVKDVWLDYLFGDGLWYNYERSDLRVRGSAYFGFLSELCTISKETIDNSIKQFQAKTFVNAEIMPEYEFLSTTSAIKQHFETTVPTRFSRSLRLLRDITHGNAFISSYFLNWEWWVKPNKTKVTFPTRPIILDNDCSCGTRSDCTKSGGIYGSFSNTEQHFSIPGWNVGCSSVETLLHSTLECLYNQTCIDIFVHYATTVNLTYPTTINISAMKPTLSSRFPMNTMIENIVDALFVEQWNISFSYTTFYKECAPIHCKYTVEKYSSFLDIMLRLLGFYGGLTISLRFIVPYLITLAFKIKNRFFTNAVTPLA